MSNQLPAPARCRFQGCGHEEPVAANLSQHIAMTHGNLQFVCEVCGLRVGTTGALTRHVASHTNQFACFVPNCGRVYPRRDELGNHLLRGHEDELRRGIDLLYNMNPLQVQQNPPQAQQNPFQAQQNLFQAQQNPFQVQQNPFQVQQNPFPAQQNPPQGQSDANPLQGQWDANQDI